MNENNDLIQLGFIRAAHALRGQVVVHIFSGQEEALTEYGPLLNADGSQSYKLTVTGSKGDDFLCKVEGVTDRNGAEALRGTRLFIPASALPETDEDEFYVKDLIGMTALDETGTTLGKVVNVTDLGHHDALEIKFGHNGQAALEKPQTEYILFTKQNVPALNLAAGTLVVNIPDGLFDIPAEK